MYNYKEFLFLIFSLLAFINIEAKSHELAKLKSIAKENGVKSEWVGANKIKVLIQNKKYEIYSYEPVENLTQHYTDDATFYNLYVAINCQFAEWTRDQIFKLIEHLP